MGTLSTSSLDLRQIGMVPTLRENGFDHVGNCGQSLTSPLKQLKRKRRAGPSIHEFLKLELDRLNLFSPRLSCNERLFTHGNIAIILSIRNEIHRYIQGVRNVDSNPYADVTPLFVPHSESLMSDIKDDYIGSMKAMRCLILEAALYREEIVRCGTSQQFFDTLQNTFLDVRRATTNNAVSPGLISAVFLLSWIDFLKADFNSFNHHIEGVILLLRSYHNSLNGEQFPPIICYVTMVASMIDACISFFGNKQQFPADLIPKDHSWLEIYVHRDEIPHALEYFERGNWMRTIANFRQWALTQRAAAGFEDPFVEEAIARQGDAITSHIVTWADCNIPKYIETPDITPTTNDLLAECDNDYSSYFQQPMTTFDPHQFVLFPRVLFESRTHNEVTLSYLGLLLLVSYCTYPQSGHLPFSRWELAVKFCQCFAAFPDAEEMDPVNRILHLFYARLTFDDSFPQGTKYTSMTDSL